ncbi:MAG: AMP-binding protein [Betaproteobacteria bacterium]|nr:AMP-binding protein [Betaproteobacteria bacterium]
MLEGFTPWPEEFARCYRERGYWEDICLAEMLERSIERYGAKEALVCGAQRISYRELGERVERLAYGLTRSGFRPHDRVVMQLHNIPEFVYAYFAMVRIGVIPIMALRAHRHTEVKHFIQRSGACGYLIPDAIGGFDYRAMAREIAPECPTLKTVLVAGEAGAGQVALGPLLEADPAPGEVRAALERLRPDPADVALMLLSGGTTALPKLIPRTHNDYVYNAKASARVAEFDTGTVLLVILPLGHNYNLASPGIQGAFACGGKVVLAPAGDADTVFSLVEKERVTVIAAAVPLIATWMNRWVSGRYDTSSLRVVQNGGARLAPELRRRVRETLGCVPQEDYGTAEGLLNMTRLDDTEEHLLESSGAPVCPDDEIKVLGENGREVADGEMGELVTRGPYTIRGYYAAPETNRDAFTADGFYRMGDLVKKRGRYVYTEGRRKDLINRGGEKISCDEVENYIFGHPKVQSVCVVAMPDDVFGEKACAFVIPKPGATLGFDELIRFLLQQNFAKFKLPERLEVVAEFPLSPAGKILRRQLKQMISDKISSERVRA